MKRLLMAGMVLGLMTNLVQANDSPKGYLGVYLGPVEAALAKHLQLEEGAGVMVLKVIEGSAADGVLETYDILLQMNGQKIGEVAALTELISGSAPGETINFDILRAGKPLNYHVTLGERPSDSEALQWNWSTDENGALMGLAPKVIMMGGDELPAELEEHLHKALESGAAGQVKVEIKCDNGQGTMTIESEGEVTTESFDCQAGGDGQGVNQKRIMKFHVGEPMKFQKQLEIAVPDINVDVPQQRFMMETPFWHAAKPKTSFRVLSSGKIEVTNRQGDAELTQEFENENDLSTRAPELFEKYSQLKATE
ncbi:MAG: hypothetical protein HJJLKODD_00254 [Phycisphaerae bacterium]|nr:hypothetical protein [Phycisphaerae bacterium]